MAIAPLLVPADRIRKELFTGAFRPMKDKDFWAYGGASEGSLFAQIEGFDVVFDIQSGTAQLFDYRDERNPEVWEIDLLTGMALEI